MRSKAILPLFFCFVIVFVAACGNNSSKGSQPSTGDTSSEVKTIKFWQFMGSMDDSTDINIAPIIEEFESTHPGVKVDVQQLTWDNGLDKITTSFAAEEAPDVVELGNTWVTQFASQDVLLDLSDKVADIKSEYVGWDGVTYDSKIYGVPWLLGTRALFYNKALFEQAGLDPEKAPANWEELKAAAAKISENTNAKGFGIAAGEAETPWTQFSMFLWSNGGEFLNEDQTASALNEPAAVEALEYVQELSEVSLVAQDGTIGQEFAAGNVGMFISGAWNLRGLTKNAPDLKWGVAEIPVAPTGNSVSFSGGEILSISAKTEYPDEAYQFVQFMTSKQNAMKVTEISTSVFPAFPGIETDPFFADKPEIAIFAKQVATARNSPSLKAWQKISEEVTTAVEKAVLQHAPAAEVLQTASDNINKLLTR